MVDDKLILVLILLVAAVIMFAFNKPRMDAVGLLMLLLLPLFGILSIEEALSGFSSPAVILIALLFVVGESLTRTGVVSRIGDYIIDKAGSSENRLIILLMAAVAGIGAFMSSTGVIAIFIPVALRISKKAKINAGRLMMPLAYAALLSGMLTLVATPPNMVVHEQLRRTLHNNVAYEGFHFFSFLPLGLPLFVLAVLYMIATRKFLSRDTEAPKKRTRPQMSEWINEYNLNKRAVRIKILPGSPLINKTLLQLDMRQSKGLNILALERTYRLSTRLITPRPDTVLQKNDVLFIDVVNLPAEETIAGLCRQFKLQRMKLSGQYFADSSQQLGMAQVMIPASSQLAGQTPSNVGFRALFDLTIVGLKRGTQTLQGTLAGEILQAGDILLLIGPWRAIRRLTMDSNTMVVLDLPEEIEDAPPAPTRALFSLIGLALMVVLMVLGVVDNVLAALITCFFLGVTRCIDLDASYRSIHWPSLILIIGMLPFSIALQKTGGVQIASDTLLLLAGGSSPHILLAALFLLTAVLGLFISNTATAVLMAPISIQIAEKIGASPYPFAMIVALAASAAFMTPVSSPVNTLVLAPGNYRFMDFVILGVPFTIVTMFIMVALVPIFFPF